MEKLCPLIKDKCIENGCMFWSHLVGTNPQTGAQMDTWNCSITWIPMLLVENSGEQRKTAASVQSFRNEMIKHQQMLIQIVADGSDIDIKRLENDHQT